MDDEDGLAEFGCCDVCNEFDCDTDHDEEYDQDDSWFFDT